MWTTFFFMAGTLFLGFPPPPLTLDHVAAGQQLVEKRNRQQCREHLKQLGKGLHEKGNGSVTKTVTLEIKGKVAFYRHIRFGRGAVNITAKNKSYWLDFGKHDDLYKLAQKADGTVIVTGTLRDADGALVVTGLKIEDKEFIKETVTVELRGRIQVDPLEIKEIYRPYGVDRFILVDGQRYYLHFGSNQQLAKLAGVVRFPIVTGRLEISGRYAIVHVASLIDIAPAMGSCR